MRNGFGYAKSGGYRYFCKTHSAASEVFLWSLLSLKGWLSGISAMES